jgi:hypothetical protein
VLKSKISELEETLRNDQSAASRLEGKAMLKKEDLKAVQDELNGAMELIK